MLFLQIKNFRGNIIRHWNIGIQSLFLKTLQEFNSYDIKLNLRTYLKQFFFFF